MQFSYACKAPFPTPPHALVGLRWTYDKHKNAQTMPMESEPMSLGLSAVRLSEEITGLSRWTLWRLERDGAFPKPIRIRGEGTKRLYVLSEVRAWVTARLAERD